MFVGQKRRAGSLISHVFLNFLLLFSGRILIDHVCRVCPAETNNYMEGINGGMTAYPAQNLYVQPPSRSMLEEAKSNLAPRGRSRNPLLDSVSLSQLDRPTSAMDTANNTSGTI